MPLRFVIPSKNRSDTIAENSLKLFPCSTVCVGEDEVNDYARVTDNLLVHPANVTGIGPIRQWIIDNIEEDVVMIDDDVSKGYTRTGIRKRRFEDPDFAQAVIERTYIAARDAGARVFGYTQFVRPEAYSHHRPIHLVGWVGGVIGVIGKDLKYDIGLMLRADVDFCLKSLLKDRFLWIDDRFEFVHVRFAGKGGNARNRSDQRHASELARIQQRWGKYLSVGQCKSTNKIKVRVERKSDRKS